jgi:hypothetical protein
MKRPLELRPPAALDVGTVGLGFGLVALIAAVMLLGVAPMAVGIGLLALLVID